MKKKTNILRRTAALCLSLVLCIQGLFPVFASDSNTIYIKTPLDLLELARNCALDTWSRDKTVILSEDISMEGLDFSGIPTFSGTFDGKGHSITELNLSDTTSPAGLFQILQSEGTVKDLTVEGTVAPAGTGNTVGGIAGESYGTIENCTFSGTVTGQDSVGGIAGINAESGEIKSCAVSGSVQGKNMTGGIVGTNLGMVRSCVSSASVNTVNTDQNLSMEDLEINGIGDLAALLSTDTLNICKDTGGIAGYSSGTIRLCENTGEIGYPHVGYNLGGIAGRSCGYIFKCTNQGPVYGRKDIGGITGQMEPYIKLLLSESTIEKLKTQLNDLSGLIDTTISDAEGASDTLTRRLNTMSSAVEAAGNALNTVGAYGSVVGQVTGSGTASGNIGTDVTTPSLDAEAGIEAGAGLDISVGTEIGAGAGLDISTGTGDTETVIAPTGHDSAEYSLSPLDVSIDASAGAGIDHNLDINQGAGIGGSISVDSSEGSIDTSGTASASGVIDATAQIAIGVSTGNLTAAISALAGQMRLLGSEAQGLSETLTEDLRNINDKISTITDILYEGMEDAELQSLGDSFTDTSGENIASVTFGKVYACRNESDIQGDINVGGISGSMAMDYDFDPEDDLTGSFSATVHRAYELKAIIQKCTSTGEITSKKDCAGGICGSVDLGLIYDSTGYGSVNSESGDYVGGIAGRSSSTILSCYAHLELSGGDYVGGIIGSGEEDELTGAGSSVTNCLSVVSILNAQQFYGAISGTESGTFLENYFVSDALEGLDRRSYSGQAERTAHENAEKQFELPEDFTEYTLRFVADDAVLQEYTFTYGASFSPEDYPEIPQKEGYYAHWDTDSLENLRYDTTVTAIYTPYTTALASLLTRDNGRPIFYAAGSFTEGDQLLATRDTTPDVSYSGSPWFDYEVQEAWSISVPTGDSNAYQLRFLFTEDTDMLLIYQNGKWTKLETESIGSYEAFSPSDKRVDMAAVSVSPVLWVWIVTIAAILQFLLLLFLLIRRLYRRRKVKNSSLLHTHAESETDTALTDDYEPYIRLSSPHEESKDASGASK